MAQAIFLPAPASFRLFAPRADEPPDPDPAAAADAAEGAAETRVKAEELEALIDESMAIREEAKSIRRRADSLVDALRRTRGTAEEDADAGMA